MNGPDMVLKPPVKNDVAMPMVSFILTVAQPFEATDGTTKPYTNQTSVMLHVH